MPIDRQIHYLELPARDLAEVRQFYGSTFGWSFTEYGDEYLAFNDGFIDGGFYKSEVSSSYADGAPLIIFYAKELEQMLETVRSNGGKIAREIYAFPGGRRFHFTDPHGNELAIWSDH